MSYQTQSDLLPVDIISWRIFPLWVLEQRYNPYSDATSSVKNWEKLDAATWKLTRKDLIIAVIVILDVSVPKGDTHSCVKNFYCP